MLNIIIAYICFKNVLRSNEYNVRRVHGNNLAIIEYRKNIIEFCL